jgi:hypothetical protein
MTCVSFIVAPSDGSAVDAPTDMAATKAVNLHILEREIQDETGSSD